MATRIFKVKMKYKYSFKTLILLLALFTKTADANFYAGFAYSGQVDH